MAVPHIGHDLHAGVSALQWVLTGYLLALASLILYIASFAMGLGPVFWLMISEIFPLNVREPAMAACTVANWSFNFLVSFTFLTLTSTITKQGTFWLYAVIGVIACAFFWWLVPETAGKSLEDIQDALIDEGGTEGAGGPAPQGA